MFLFVFFFVVTASEPGIPTTYPIHISLYDKFSKVVVDFSSIRGQKIFGWMLIFNLF